MDGTGDTQCVDDADCNGLGNLIVGYDEDFNHKHLGILSVKVGSHNLVIGTQNSYTRSSGIVVGDGNKVLADGATILGGSFNTASGLYSTVSVGFFNEAANINDAVSGGQGVSTKSTETLFGQGKWAAGGYKYYSTGQVYQPESSSNYGFHDYRPVFDDAIWETMYCAMSESEVMQCGDASNY